MKTFCTVLIALLALGVAHGQNYNDALRYSFTFPQGSARFAGTGGSLTAMGVDVTTLHTNPAGIGWNRYNMAQVTPGFSLTNTGSTLNFGDNASTSDGAATFTLPSAGIVFAGNTRSVNWSTLNFGISLSRVADYNQQISFSGRSPGSIIESFAELADIGVTDAYGVDLANNYLIDFNEGVYSDFYDFDADLPRGESISRNGLYDRRGSMNEVAIGFGGNYREKLLWGLSFGIPFLSYDEVLTYEEVDDQGLIPAFENSAYNQNLNASGTGFNLKTGLTWLPTEQLRLSAAVHSPTFWTIDEQYSTTFGYFYTEDGEALGGTELSPLASYTYNLRTPWRFMLGGGYMLGTRGFLSVDADYMNYTGNSISFDDFATSTEASDAANADIDAILSSSIGVRVGGELNFKPLQVRAGIGYRQVPFADYVNNEDQGILTYSAGAGYSVGKFFVDMAAQYEGYSTFQSPYETLAVSGQTVLTDRTRVSVLLTVGFRGFTAGF